MAQTDSKIIEPEEARLRWLKSFGRREQRRFFPAGFGIHERVAGKFLRGSQYIYASRPGVGKTANLVTTAYQLARQGILTVYASLGIPVERLWNRLACLHDPELTLRELNETDPTPERIEYFEKLSREVVNFSPRFFEDSDFTAFVKTMKEQIQPARILSCSWTTLDFSQ